MRNARQRQRCCRKSRKRSRDAQRFSLTAEYVPERTYSRRSPSDGVLIARPFVTAVYGGGDEGVKMYIARLRRGLEDAMTMCGAADIASISRDMIRI